MDKQTEAMYKWLPSVAEWYQVTGEIYGFDSLGKLKGFFKEIVRGYTNGNSAMFKLELGTWILITNVNVNPGEPSYLEFLIRKDQHGQADEHSQQIFFMPMFPPEKPTDKNVNWTKLLKKVEK